MVSPQRWWHGHLVTMLTVALMEQAPADVRVGREMTIRLDQRNRPEPDLLPLWAVAALAYAVDLGTEPAVAHWTSEHVPNTLGI